MLGATLPTLGAAVWDNSCLARPSASLVPPTVGAPATFLPHCAAWVVNTTDAVWLPSQTDAQVRAALRESFYEDWASTSNGRSFRGMATLESLVFATKRAFPDLQQRDAIVGVPLCLRQRANVGSEPFRDRQPRRVVRRPRDAETGRQALKALLKIPGRVDQVSLGVDRRHVRIDTKSHLGSSSSTIRPSLNPS